MTGSLIIEGGFPLTGNVKATGSRNSSILLIIAALFSNEDVLIDNVPRSGEIDLIIKLISSLGAKVIWSGHDKVLVNGSGINVFEVPSEFGSKTKYSVLLAAPLLFRFGRAQLPLFTDYQYGWHSITRLIDTWKSLGNLVDEQQDTLLLSASDLHSCVINFKVSTFIGTTNAILSSLFIPGECLITNASEEYEIDKLIDFCNLIGGSIERISPRTLKVIGSHVFKGCYIDAGVDLNEAVVFSTAAVMTHGNITIDPINKLHLASFASFLSKVGCKYEFYDNEMRVCYLGEPLEPTNITITPAPGFSTLWQPYGVLFLTKTKGESFVHDTIYTNSFGFIAELNKMGAKIINMKPSEIGILPIISVDGYNIKNDGEPKTIAKIFGPSKFKETTLVLNPAINKFVSIFILALLSVNGKSEIQNFDPALLPYENFLDKLANLGARIYTK